MGEHIHHLGCILNGNGIAKKIFINNPGEAGLSVLAVNVRVRTTACRTRAQLETGKQLNHRVTL